MIPYTSTYLKHLQLQVRHVVVQYRKYSTDIQENIARVGAT